MSPVLASGTGPAVLQFSAKDTRELAFRHRTMRSSRGFMPQTRLHPLLTTPIGALCSFLLVSFSALHDHIVRDFSCRGPGRGRGHVIILHKYTLDLQ